VVWSHNEKHLEIDKDVGMWPMTKEDGNVTMQHAARAHLIITLAMFDLFTFVMGHVEY
jgi:hypothetical protein